MRRALALAIVAGLSLTVRPSASAWACSCAPRSDREAARQAVVVFVGTAEGTRPVPGAPTAEVTRFAVEASYKGPPAPGHEISIIHETQPAACGLAFAEGRRYTVFAGAFHERLIASSCSPTAAGTLSASALGLPTRLIAEPGSRWPGWIAAAAVWVVLLAIAVALVRRSLRRRPV